MKYSTALLVSVLAAIAKAVEITNTEFSITAGEPYTITWTGAVGDVTIKLKNGESGDLKDVETIVTGASGGSFTWTPESDLPSDVYAFEITDSSGDVNYSGQFTFQGTGTPSATTSTASSTSASSTSSSSTKSSSSSNETSSTTSSARVTSSTMTPITNSTTLTTSTGSTSRSSTTASSTSSSASSTATEVPNTNNGQRLASSLALVVGAIAAFVAFN